MNKKQILIIWIGTAIITLMGLFPPFLNPGMLKTGLRKFEGYHFFLTDRTKRRSAEVPITDSEKTHKSIADYIEDMQTQKKVKYIYTYVLIDYQRLFMQWFLVFLITTVLFFTKRDQALSNQTSSINNNRESK